MKLRMAVVTLLVAASLLAQDRQSPLNEHFPNWISLGASVRYRGEGQHGLGFVEGNNQDYFLQRYRFDVRLQPLEWLGVYGEMQDSRGNPVVASDAAIKDSLDLRQAYLRVGKASGWWDIKAGRQTMSYGSERVIGASEWGNTARVFDAARLSVHHGKNKVDVFASSVVVNNAREMDHHWEGNNLHGVYGSIGSLVKNATIEPYVLYRASPLFVGEPGHSGPCHSWTSGIRFASSPSQSPWSYEFEALAQRGEIGPARLSAWAATAQVRRRFASLFWTPSFLAETNYASGDHRRNDNVVNTLDQLYPTNHGIYGIADQIGRRNSKNVRAGWWVKPEKWLTLKAEGHYFWLADANDALYAAGGAVSVPSVRGGAKYTAVGPELDLLADVKLSKYYDVGAQVGHLFPGPFLRAYSAGGGRTFYAVFLDVHL